MIGEYAVEDRAICGKARATALLGEPEVQCRRMQRRGDNKVWNGCGVRQWQADKGKPRVFRAATLRPIEAHRAGYTVDQGGAKAVRGCPAAAASHGRPAEQPQYNAAEIVLVLCMVVFVWVVCL